MHEKCGHVESRRVTEGDDLSTREVGDPPLKVGDEPFSPRRCVESSSGMHESVAMWNPEGELRGMIFLPWRSVICHSRWEMSLLSS